MTIRGFKIAILGLRENHFKILDTTVILKPQIVIDKTRIMDDYPWFLV